MCDLFSRILLLLRIIRNKRRALSQEGTIRFLTFTRLRIMKTNITKTIAVTVCSLGNLAALNVVADDGELSPLTVVGGKDRVADLVGSAAYVDTEDIRKHNDPNINRILAKVPGVYIREEDGYGNFPNISIRGVDGSRSSKVTIMEDGILSAPATYSAPSAYYSPHAGRMHGLEVLKGSSQIKYGPHTTGGVINYLSTPIPEDHHFFARLTYGSDGTFKGHAYYGDIVNTNNGKFGYLLEMFYSESDGFRNIQGSSRDTGYQRIEPMLKLFWEPDSAVKQRFEFKFGYTDFDANESYLGLTEADRRSNPFDRYAASQFDNIDTFQYRTYLKWLIEPSENVKIETTAYYNRFNRNWYKLHDLRGIANGGGGTSNISLHQALLGSSHPTDAVLGANALAVLQGTGAGNLRVRANNRDYYSYGLQTAGQFEFETGSLEHSLIAGARYHVDRVRRFQWNDIYTADGMGGFSLTSPGVGGDAGNRRQQTHSLALFAEDAIKIGRTTIRPGVRWEHLDVEFQDFATNESDSGTYSVWSGGIGFTHELCDTDRIYGGIYRGVSIPGPRSHLRSGIDEEETLSYELGWRHANEGFVIDVAGFFTDFDNLIARENIGGGLSADRNAGDAEVWGFELTTSYDFAYNCDGYSMPVYFTATWTSAELKNALGSGGEDDIWAGGTDGSDFPYVPEWKLAAGIGLHMEKWGANLDATYTSHQYGTAKNLDEPVTSSREGKIDSAFVVDLSGYYKIDDNWKLIGGVNNLFGEEYVTSRVPHGPRNARGRHLYAGFEVKF